MVAPMPRYNRDADRRNETLRLQPAVGSGLQRAPEVGTGGKVVGN